MKTVKYKSKETGLVSAVFLISGDNGDLLLLPKSHLDNNHCLVLCEHNHRQDCYDGDDNGSWTNVSNNGDISNMIENLIEFKNNKFKINEEYKSRPEKFYKWIKKQIKNGISFYNENECKEVWNAAIQQAITTYHNSNEFNTIEKLKKLKVK